MAGYSALKRHLGSLIKYQARRTVVQREIEDYDTSRFATKRSSVCSRAANALESTALSTEAALMRTFGSDCGATRQNEFNGATGARARWCCEPERFHTEAPRERVGDSALIRSDPL